MKPTNENIDSNMFDFMLGELSSTRNEMQFYTKRFEDLLDFFLKIVLASLSAIILIVSTYEEFLQSMSSLIFLHFALPNKDFGAVIMLCIVLLGTLGFGVIIFLRLLITRVMMAYCISMQRRNQEFFFKHNDNVRKYATVLLHEMNWTKWVKVIFSSQSIAQFWTFAAFLSVLAFFTSIIILAIISQIMALTIQKVLLEAVYLIGGVGGLVIVLLSCLKIMDSQSKKAFKTTKDNLKEIFDLGIH